ncbi:structural maintenance of chromosomes protein 2 [Frankliniella occidentalis]|uniref:Structural maintenance of chromosomes protein n=1 Tax=Frankliniella occidentalis TaxID=133901 RepID=A0A6J1THA9_FRAOC|nr:structural maintenance of chromosomes protein 2 [Frankliniella occidentalis]
MHIKSIILDGFKSYGQRTEVNGFDPEFNAITGLNGSGKSNILDSICFVLGITNLGQVRAGSLQDLVYKSGQAGITKASVTIKFDNSDRSSGPIGYEQYDEITVTRQTVVGGKNKYLINGTNVTNKRVMDMFCSVQLNVNNPHFLIMQGRITKVLNMKPPEILSMVEEAAGTRMYEGKKQAANKTIEKKDSKLNELDEIIQQDVGPRLQKLKDDKAQYLEYQKVNREVEHLSRIHIAWRYKTAEKASKELQSSLEVADQTVKKREQSMLDGEKEISRLGQLIETITAKIGEEEGSNLGKLEKELKAKEKVEAELTAQIKAHKDSLSTEEKRKKQLEKSLKEDEQILAQKQAEHGKTGGKFSSLKEAEAADAEAFAAAQRKYQAVSAGLLSSEDGADATLQEQLMAAKQAVSTASSEKKQSEMEMQHIKSELLKKEKLLNENSKTYSHDVATLAKLDKEVTAMASEISQIQYEDGMSEKLEEQRVSLGNQIRSAQQKASVLETRYPQLTLKYQDPVPNFDRRKVKGLVCRMFTVKDPKFTQALESAAGGKLYFVITDNEETSKLILQRGQLQQRCTIIPINRITGRSMDARTIRLAQQVGGQGKVFSAMDLIEFEPELRPAMEWVFGQVFICTDCDAAAKVTYNKEISKRCVTVDGDVFDPAGTLSGGAAGNRQMILSVLQELRSAQDFLQRNTEEMKNIEHQLRNVSGLAERFKSLTQKHAMKASQAAMLREQINQTDRHQITVEVKSLKERVDELTAKVTTCETTIKEGQQKAKSIEVKMKDAKSIREKELKAAQAEMDRLKKKAEESRVSWKKHEQEFESANLEIEELRSGIISSQKQIEEITELIAKLTTEIEEFSQKLEEAKVSAKEMHEQVKAKKHEISVQNKEIHDAQKRQDLIKKSLSEWELEIKRLKLDSEKLKSNAANSEQVMENLSNKYEWIEKDKSQFGNRGGLYDFQENNPKETEKRLAKLEETKEKLGRNLNTRAMNLLSKEEEQYTEVLRKKGIVEHDKQQLRNVIAELDEKKKTRLMEAWEQVNKDFGSIFSTLLPGAKARLTPPQGLSVLDGLEVKVGFGNIWKESLNELSGGQRSLVALSLILAMLLFKPAPIYILDEVDAALDLSHTQNIGTMLKKHFHHSQFIVVSLKDGMFNNANVLFRTKFVDGMSTVGRTVQVQNRDDESKKGKKGGTQTGTTAESRTHFLDKGTLPEQSGQSGKVPNGSVPNGNSNKRQVNLAGEKRTNGIKHNGVHNGVHNNGAVNGTTADQDSDEADEGIMEDGLSSGSDSEDGNPTANQNAKRKKK